MDQTQKDLAARKMAEWLRSHWPVIATVVGEASGGTKLPPDEALEVLRGALAILGTQWVDLKTTFRRKEVTI